MPAARSHRQVAGGLGDRLRVVSKGLDHDAVRLAAIRQGRAMKQEREAKACRERGHEL